MDGGTGGRGVAALAVIVGGCGSGGEGADAIFYLGRGFMPAIFAETLLPKKLADALAREAGVKTGVLNCVGAEDTPAP